jgi:hypothetical protein
VRLRQVPRGNLKIESLFRISSALIILGTLVELASLIWFHPLAFVLFAFVGTPLTGLGVLIYLASLVYASARAKTEPEMIDE